MGIFRSVVQQASILFVLVFVAVTVAQFYYLQEMLAALALFTIVFGSVAAILLLIFVLDRAGEAIISFVEVRAKDMLHHARMWRPFFAPRPRI